MDAMPDPEVCEPSARRPFALALKLAIPDEINLAVAARAVDRDHARVSSR